MPEAVVQAVTRLRHRSSCLRCKGCILLVEKAFVLGRFIEKCEERIQIARRWRTVNIYDAKPTLMDQRACACPSPPQNGGGTVPT